MDITKMFENQSINNANYNVKRYPYWDNLKFLLIFLVVLCHFIDVKIAKNHVFKSIYLFVYSFHMPLFIFVSGLFFDKSGKTNRQRAISYFLIYFLIRLFVTVTRYSLNDTFDFRLFGNENIGWFIFVLGVYTLITDFIVKSKINLIKLLPIAFIVGILVGYDKSIGDDFALSRICIFYPFFLIGVIIDTNVFFIIKESKLKFIFIILTVLFLLLCFKYSDTSFYKLRYFFTARHSYPKLKLIHWGGVLRLLAYFITMITSIAIISVIPNKTIPLITQMGSKTMQVYFWHMVFFWILYDMKILSKLADSFWGSVLIVLISIFLTVLLSTKPFSFPIRYVTRKEISIE